MKQGARCRQEVSTPRFYPRGPWCGDRLRPGIKWIKGALIGAGSFGKVYLGMDATNGLLMAVKQVEVPTTASDERKLSMTDALEREIELLKDLQHANIVQYLCASFIGLRPLR